MISKTPWLLLAVAAALPSSPSLSVAAVTWREDFASPPLAHGWRTVGDAALFRWNETNQNLEVTWDSSRPNSYYARPLGTVLARSDDFSFELDLRLNDINAGTTEGKPYAFQIAAGLLRWAEATSPGFLRGTATNSPDLAEFDYFPDTGYGATVSPTLISSNSEFATGFTFPLELTLGDNFHLRLSYTAANHTLVTTLTKNGQPFGQIQDVRLGTEFSDFRLDHFAVCSYSDAGQDPMWSGSVLAHGVVDNVVVTVADGPATRLSPAVVEGQAGVRFSSRSNWVYTLERTVDWHTWTPVAAPTLGTGLEVLLPAADAETAPAAFYRVRADRP
jgi:hypothetical protein